jgi:ribosomal protein S18 acetylase RimI-like enzyme
MTCPTHSTAVPTPDIRWAKRQEARDIARLFLIASDGLAGYIWSRLAGPDRPLEETGAERYARDGVDFSYRNCLFATRKGDILGMVHAFAMAPWEAGEIEEDPVLRPYAELEDPGSLYIAGLAVYGRHRGQGIGGRLMEAAAEIAVSRGCPRMSLICFERNERALRFYRKLGFRETARRPIVPHPALHYSDGDALLLVRAV